MRILLSTIGSRGDVQPLLALAIALAGLGEEVRLCVPPDFQAWIEGTGLEVVPIGPPLRATGRPRPDGALPTPEQRQALVEGTVRTQFETISAAACGCDLVVGATALQVAAPSIAEHLGIPHVFVAYCPAVLPSPLHAPPVLAMLGDAPAATLADYGAHWAQDATRWNETWRAPINAQRAALGLPAIDDVRGHVHTRQPWLAADPVLGPWPAPGDGGVLEAGAWILVDDRPLPDELNAFLDAGEPPVYFGFGSCRASPDLAATMVAAARAHERRVVLSRGWAGLTRVDDAVDCIEIDEVNQQALFQRVSAVVHHGGAGTTTTAARAGAPQVVIPQHYDQHYWAARVDGLGIGTAHRPGPPDPHSLANALARSLQPAVAARARIVAAGMRADGAALAARRLRTIARGHATGPRPGRRVRP